MADQLQWLSAEGTLITLTDPVAGYRVLANTTGLNAPTYRFAVDQYAGLDGTKVQAIAADARTVNLALMVQAPDRDSFRARVAALTRAMRPKAGQGTLIVTDEHGVVRSLRCYYRSGLEGDEARGVKLPGRWWKASVELYAPDPWWYGDTRSVTFSLGPSSVFFPIFPLALSASTVQGMFTVDLSDTDTGASPVWTITGPGTALTLTNETTGKVIQVNASVGSGETIVIDTRPGQQSVRRGDGTNLMASVASDPALWTLTDGVNVIAAGLTGATSESRIFGAWVPRYAGI